MNKLFIYSSIFSFSLLNVFASDFLINVGDINISKAEVESYKFSKMGRYRLSDAEIKERLVKESIFAEAYLNSAHEIDIAKMKNSVRERMSSEYIKNYLNNIKLEDEESVYKSYYEMHKDKYKKEAIVDLYIFTFDTKEEANLFYGKNINLKSLKDINQYNKKFYEALSLNSLNSIHRYVFDELGIDTLSKPMELHGKFKVLYYTNFQKSGFFSYEEMRERIKEYLINKKRNEFIKELFEKITKKEQK